MGELPKAGWYRDPVEPSTQRYWDGEQWLGASIPADATPPDGPLLESPTAPAPPTASALEAPPARRGAAPGRGSPAGMVGPVPGRAPGTVAVALDPAALAPLSARVLARIVDILAVLALNVVVNGYFVVQYVREVLPVARTAGADLMAGKGVDLPEQAVRLLLVISAIAIGLWFAYEVPAIANSGQTPGKRLAGIRVARLVDGQTLSFGQSFRRWLLLALPSPLIGGVPLLPLQLLDLLWCVWDRPARQCLHDKPVHSIVVRADPVGPTAPPSDH